MHGHNRTHTHTHAFVSGYDRDEMCRDIKDQVVCFAFPTPGTCRSTVTHYTQVRSGFEQPPPFVHSLALDVRCKIGDMIG